MMHWYQKIINKWLHPEHKFSFVDDLPEKIKNKTIYIVGSKEHPWLIAFNCPCDCKNLIQLNLLKEADPCWTFRVNKKGKIDILPSVWRTKGCESHFFVRKSKIDWVGNFKANKTSVFFDFWKMEELHGKKNKIK
jgi:hypothetical protein